MVDRRTEWSVPKFGPERFRVGVGLLFLPYTGMVISFTLMGSMLAETIHWDRVVAIVAIYFLALGIGANSLDAVGSKVKPWGTVFSRRELLSAAVISLIVAYSIGIYYMLYYTPLLWVIAILEGFFLLAYNLEWFNGQFHTDEWFVLSWGFLPTLSGYVLQTNRLTLPPFLMALGAGFLAYIEITAERPYKELRRRLSPPENEIAIMYQYENILKGISFATILFGVGLTLFRLIP